jgi:hypothetical protein
MFGVLRPNVMASKDAWPDVKKQIFVGMLTPAVLDGAEHWIISDSKRRELNVVFNAMVRSSLRFASRVTRKCRVTRQEMHGKLGLENLDHYLDQRTLGHAGHVERVENERLPKLLRGSCLVGGMKRGRPQKTHADQTKQCMKRKGVAVGGWKNVARNRNEWHAAMRGASVCDKNGGSRRDGKPHRRFL